MSGAQMRVAVGVVVLVALAAAFATAQFPTLGQATTVGIAVPPTQVLDGTTVHVLTTPGSSQPGHLTIKSNIPWTLQVEVSAAPGQEAAWRQSNAESWEILPPSGTVLRGPKGIHVVEYALRVSAGSLVSASEATVRFAIQPAP